MQASSSSKRGRPAWTGPAAALAIALLASGCGPQYEYDRPGTWRPTGANTYNLQAMVADPRDLTVGQASATDRGNGAARAVTRLYTDRRRNLLDVSISRVAPPASGGDSGGAGSGGSTAGTTSGSVGQ